MKKAEISPLPELFVSRSLEWVVLLSPFLFGLFFPWGSAVVTVVFSVLLSVLLRHKSLHSTRSPVFFFALAIVAFQLGAVLWGTDRGMAPFGAVQFLPLPLFVLLLEQLAPERRLVLIRRMPYTAAFMVVLSFLLSRVPLFENWFLYSGRQSGFFQYPNAYAIYLLLAVILLLFGEPLLFGPLPWLVLLVAGIALTGSRIVFVILILVLTVFLFRKDSGKLRLPVLGLIVLSLVGSVLYVLFTGNRQSIGRFLTISLSSTELLSRLVYVKDALPMILRHPLGLGYTGYQWLQGSFQSSLYTVRYVHNELLQLALDTGWFPAALFLWVFWRGIRSRKGGFCRRILLLALSMHCLLDFDTQFVSIALLLFLLMDTEPQASRPVKSLPVLYGSAIILASFLSVWLGLSSFLSYAGHPSAAVRIYPGNTQALVDLLPNTAEEELKPLSDRILRLNDNVSLAHDAKARLDFSSGDIMGMQEHKLKAIRLAKYWLPEYLEYFDYLRYSYELYLQQGDQSSADWVLSQIKDIPGMLEDVKQQTSQLGWRIGDLLPLELPEEYAAWLEGHRGPDHLASP